MEKIIRKTFYKFFVPTIVSSLALAVVSMTDLIAAGQLLGKEAFTAISLALPVIIFVQIMAALFGNGAAIMLSGLLGKGDLKKCNEVFTIALITASVIGIAAGAGGTLFREPLLRLLGASGNTMMETAGAYIGILFYGMPCLILAPVFQVYLRNDSKPRYSMICVLASGFFNMVMDIVFVAVFHMGVMGIALATVLSQVLSCVLSANRLFFGNRSFRLVRVRFQLSDILQIIEPGFPMAVIFFFQIVLTIAINHTLMAGGGGDSVAVYAVVKYLITFIYAFYDGVTGAVQPMLCVYYGEEEMENLRLTVRISMNMILRLSVGITLVLLAAAPLLCRIFGVESGAMEQAAVISIRVQALFCVTAALIAFLGAYYRCTGQARVSMLLSVCDNFLFPVPLVTLLGRTALLGNNGVYVGLVLADYGALAVWWLYCMVTSRSGRSKFLRLDETEKNTERKLYKAFIQDKYEDIPCLIEQIEGFCEENHVSGKKMYYVSLCIEELVVNIIKLGFGKSRENYIDIRLAVEKDGTVSLRIRDDATEFDPTKMIDPDIRTLSNEEQAGNINELGLFMVKKVATSYFYKRTVGFNDFMVVL